MKHTELPWLKLESTMSTDHPEFDIRVEKSLSVADGGCVSATKEDAAFIVKAVNNHYKQKELNSQLLEALRLCMEVIELEIADGEYTDAFINGSEVIKQAEAE